MAVDLGKSVDYSAISINERAGYLNQIRHLERLPPGMSYTDQVDRLVMLTRYSHIDRLVVDATGLGTPIADMLRKAGLKPIGITITGGNEPTFNGSSWHVPKRDLIGAAIVAFQNKQVKIADLPERKALLDELQNFEIKISQSGHDSYAAAGTGHDDLVLSLSMGIYAANRLYRKTPLDFSMAKGYGNLLPEKEELCYYEKRDRALIELFRSRRKR